MKVNIVSARQALADGIHPGELFRAARANEREGKRDVGAVLRNVARELADLMGMRIRHRAANDNRGGAKRRAA